MLYTPPINTNLGVPPSSSSVSKHWATILSPSPSPGTTSQTTISSSSSPSSATPKSSISLPPLHTAVPMASLESYRRASDNSPSPIHELLLRPPPLSAQPRPVFPASASATPIQADRQNRPPPPQLFIQTPDNSSPFAFAPPEYSSINNIKSPRKRADFSQLSVLTRAFAKSPYPSTEERDRLSKKLGMTSRSVQIWFQNRRRAVKVQQESVGHQY